METMSLPGMIRNLTPKTVEKQFGKTVFIWYAE